MKILNLLLWVGQFGFSIIFPTLLFLYIGVRLQTRFGLGIWFVALMGILGILTSVSTTRSCLRSLRNAAEEAGGDRERPVSFNDHN